MNQNKNKYNNALPVYRRRMGFSQTEVADLLGYTSQMISMYETGRTLPPFVTALKLAILYRIPIEFLYHDMYVSLREQLRLRERERRQPFAQLGLF